MVRVRSGIAIAVASVGCSLITPLDFVGGSAGSSGGSGNTGGNGGAAGGKGGSGGMGAAGGKSEGGRGGSSTGGMGGSGVAGSGGESGESGAGGEAGQGGIGEGGVAGSGLAGGGGASGGGAGGTAGDSAGTAGGGGCAGADLVSDPMHCGACGTTCGATEFCIEGSCVASPCDGLCATFVTVPLVGDGFRMDDIGTAEQCFEVVGYERMSAAPALVCWNFLDPRTLEINATPAACMTEPGVGLPEQRAGGYCVKVSAGDHSYAGFKFPLP